LQRRLASSPEAIYQSLKRRRERLQRRLQEEKARKRAMNSEIDFSTRISQEDWDDDFEDYSSQERETTEEEVVDQATAARTIAELQAEIDQLRELENLALQVKRSGKDRKWEELSKLLQNQAEMFDAGGYRRKLVIFTEHRDTLNYLTERIGTLLGRPEAVATIHGGMGREERKNTEEAFKQDVNVDVLVATDAAGEGINLQRAHLMVNYDLPWNPNRLEQRFGRIHRIGQTEVCHLWNLVAEETREGDVYLTLLKKLEIEQTALGGQVFDILGKALAGKELRELLIEAIRYGDRAEVKEKLNQAVSERVDRNRLQELLEERALVRDSMDASKIQKIRESMERAEARKVQPHFIASFFLEAFQRLGGSIRQRESRRYEITHVPAVIRNRDQAIGMGNAIMRRYERICFQKELISIPGKPLAEFVCPGHPLLTATIDLILERHRDLLRQGAILVDDNDFGETVRALVYLEHSIQDARPANNGQRQVVSRRMQYVEIPSEGEAYSAGYAPYLDYRPLAESEQSLVESVVEGLALREDIERQASSYAIANLVPQHLQEVRERKEELIEKTRRAVKDRLTKEINYWDQRAADLRLQEQAGKVNAKLNSEKAQQRADELSARLQKRLSELEQERKLSPQPPVVVGGTLVVPIGLIQRLQAKRNETASTFARETQRVEQLAMAAVMQTEQNLGYQPRDVSDQKCGYDIESLIPETAHLRFLEVKGRIQGAETVTVTKNEILTALNKGDSYLLALVEVPTDEQFSDGDAFAVREATGNYQVAGKGCTVRYLQEPFQREPDFGASSVNYRWREMWERGTKIEMEM